MTTDDWQELGRVIQRKVPEVTVEELQRLHRIEYYASKASDAFRRGDPPYVLRSALLELREALRHS